MEKTKREQIGEILEDSEFALIEVRNFLSLLKDGIDEVKDDEIESKFDDLLDIIERKVEVVMNKKQ